MKQAIIPALCLAVLSACGTEAEKNPAPTPLPPVENIAEQGPAWKRIDLQGLDDNVKHDTLLIQTTFDLGDGTFLMVASNVAETREGVRLYLYTPNADSSAHVIASSKPGYDSETMLPTFFGTGNKADGWILLANMGERESWGQEVFWLKDQRFIHLGFVDVAQRDWKVSEDTSYQWRVNIAPRAEVYGENGTFSIVFSGDSVQLYDDLQGHREVMFPASSLRYKCVEGKATLMINGTAITAPEAI
jgi:hypothetical protein